MKTIEVYKAQDIHGDEIPSVTLHIVKPIPELKANTEDPMATLNDFFGKQADSVMEALGSLPQGTLNQVLIRLLKTKQDFYMGR